MLRQGIFLLVGAALVLAACSGSATPELEQELRIGFSEAAGAVRASLLGCIPEEVAGRVRIEPVLGGTVDVSDYDLLIRLGETSPLPEFAVPLGQEEILAVVQAGNPIGELSTEQLAAVFSGRIQDWSELGGQSAEIELWIGLPGDEVRELFQARILLGGEFSGEARLATSASEMQAAVAGDPAAIGLLPASLLSEGLRGMEIGIQAPILGLAATEPDAALHTILLCMQSLED